MSQKIKLQSLSRRELLEHAETLTDNADLLAVLQEFDRRLSVEKAAWGQHLPRLHAAESKAATLEALEEERQERVDKLVEQRMAEMDW